MKLCCKFSSFHRVRSSLSLNFSRKFHGPPKKEEYTAVAQYPEIPQFKNEDEAKYAELKKLMKSLNTVEEKQIYLNKPKYYGWYSCVMSIENIPPESLNLMQYATNTTIVKNELPEKLKSLDEKAYEEAKRFQYQHFIISRISI